MMKTKLKFFFDALTPKAGRANLRQCEFTIRKFFALCLLAMVAQVGMAEDRVGTTLVYDFSALPNDFAFEEGTTVTNSLGESMTILKDASNSDVTGTRFAVADAITDNGTDHNRWYIHSNGGSTGLYSRFSGYRKLSIMGLSAGNKVKISFYNVDESNTINVRSNNVSGKTGVKNLSNLNPTGSSIDSDEELTISTGGSLDLWVGRYIAITKVVIDDGKTSGKGYHVDFNTTGAISNYQYNGTSYSPAYKTQLSARNFVEPTIISVYPSTASVSYSVSTISSPTGKDVAIMDTEVAGNLLFKNIGLCQVTATITVGGNNYSDSYYVEAWDDIATYVIEENGARYRLNGAGVLPNRVVTAIPGMVMRFGIPKNYPANGDYNESIVGENDVNYTTDNTNDHYQPNSVVVALNDGHMTSNIYADNGWRHRFPYRGDRYPYQGTFYTFTATVAGKLTLGGIKSVKNAKVLYLNQEDPIGERGCIFTEDKTENDRGDNDYADAGYHESKQIDMTPGKTYIVHGEVDGTNNRWCVFELEWFKFDSSFKIVDGSGNEKPYGIASTCGASSVTSLERVKIAGSFATATVKSVSVKGTISSSNVAVDNNGYITFNDITYATNETNKKGGAIKVTLTNGTETKDYVMTIPYGKHVWDFRQTENQISNGYDDCEWQYTKQELITMMKGNGTDWSRVYGVAHKTNGVWDNDSPKMPIISARSSINGNNAFYMDNTAGLVIVAGSESFGAGETDNSSVSGKTKDEQYVLNYTTTEGADLLYLKGNATIYFPGVTAGQYIKLYTYRHSDDSGECFKMENLEDLDGKAYNSEHFIRLRGLNENRYPGYVGNDIKGAAIFRVPTGNYATQNLGSIPSITLSDNGWAQIYRIEIMDTYEPDLVLTMDDAKDASGVSYNLPINEKNNIYSQCSSIVVRKHKNADGTYTYSNVTKSFSATPGNTRCQSANTCRYEVIASGPTVTTTRSTFLSSGGVNYNKLELEFGGGTGLVKIIQREVVNSSGLAYGTSSGATGSGEYTIDKNEYYLAVGELTVQDYPYTWDLTQYNKTKNASNSSYNAMNGANTAGIFGQWTSTSANSHSGFYPNSIYTQTMDTHTTHSVAKPLATQGAQLVAGSTTLVETEGLGISLPYASTNESFTVFYTDKDVTPNVFVKGSRSYKVYDTDASNSIVNTSDELQDIGTITIPEVGQNYYIFVKASAEPTTVKAGGTTLTKLTGNDDIFSVQSGVYLYKQTESGAQDVEVTFASSTNVEIVAVTDIVKEIGTTGYATESRDHAIDHTYQGKLTNHDVNAYAITTYNGETYNYKGYPMVKKSVAVGVVPTRTGIVLYEDLPSGETTHTAINSPLFYPAVNVTTTSDETTILTTDNWMAPSVAWDGTGLAKNGMTSWNEEIDKGTAQTGTADGTWCTKFILSSAYWVYEKDGTDPGATESQLNNHTTTAAFYRMRLVNGHNTLAGNKAYLLIPTANLPTALWKNGDGQGIPGQSREGVIYIDLQDFEENDATGVKNADADIYRSTDNDVYYSISGTRINGKPTAKGFYIHNGKKVSVK